MNLKEVCNKFWIKLEQGENPSMYLRRELINNAKESGFDSKEEELGFMKSILERYGDSLMSSKGSKKKSKRRKPTKKRKPRKKKRPTKKD